MIRAFTLLLVLASVTMAVAREPEELTKARHAYASLKQPSEAQRVKYITRLVRLRERFGRGDEALDAIDSEIVRHPMPASVDARILSRRLVGRWQSPRHSYVYRADGAWSMADDGLDAFAPGTTGGTWRIDGNQIFANAQGETQQAGETLILLTDTDLIYGLHDHPFYHRRGRVFPWH